MVLPYKYLSVYTYKNLHLIKSCLCCFLEIHLYSSNLSTIATIYSLNLSELFPAFFSCGNSFNLLQSSSGSDDKNNVFGTPEAIIAGALSSFISYRSLVDFVRCLLSSKSISFAKLYFNFLSVKLARSTF